MAQVRGEGVSFDAVDSGNEELRRDLARLQLKVGAPIILLKIIDDNLVNSSQGVVRVFADEADFEYLGGEGGDEALVPLLLGLLRGREETILGQSLAARRTWSPCFDVDEDNSVSGEASIS